MPEPVVPYSDDQLIDFCVKLDGCGKIEVTDWEAGFLDGMLKWKNLRSDKQRMGVFRMIEKYAAKIPWSVSPEESQNSSVPRSSPSVPRSSPSVPRSSPSVLPDDLGLSEVAPIPEPSEEVLGEPYMKGVGFDGLYGPDDDDELLSGSSSDQEDNP